jgi:malonate-semialdehyde dehydrogenase (acetylating)/methylmalonate-semialdehyde dehydrogenase
VRILILSKHLDQEYRLMTIETLQNFIDGDWVHSQSDETLEIHNPATGEVIAKVPLSTATEVEAAIDAAHAAFDDWRETPPYARARYFFRLKELMEERFEDIARVVVREHGKFLDEARGEVRRAIENVEVAAGVPSLMMGYSMEDVAHGIDEEAVIQPVGVFCCVAPFNFPAMVPYWFMPYAVACGNTYIIKPSEVCPMTQSVMFELIEEVDFPPGVINMVHGDKQSVNTMLEHPLLAGVSFVGSTPVGKIIYQKAAEHDKRAQCQAGAKNCVIVMPDAVLDNTVANTMTSAFGNSGQRCLANSLVLMVGGVGERLTPMLAEMAKRIKVGNGMDETVQMGPVVSKRAYDRIMGYIERGLEEGAHLLLDGRDLKVEGGEKGYFIGPTIFTNVTPEMKIAQDEIFGPVLGIMDVEDFDQALDIIHGLPYGNAASIFTTSGKWAREFKYRAKIGNIGVNIGIAAPIASFPFGGKKNSFFGDLHGQGRDAIQFFTDRKVVITRWF